MNEIAQNQELPDESQEGEFIRIYKEKGILRSTERGSTLASNFEKVFERMINKPDNKVSYMDSQEQ